jgi:UDP-GlcNAc:undecaprenyl-phosphate GlcNAc-1-phosphate transferase
MGVEKYVNVISYLLVLVVAAIVSYSVTPPVIAFIKKIGALDVPTDRKVHAKPTPTLGGVAIFLAFFAAFLAASALEEFSTSFGRFFDWPLTEPAGIAIGTLIIFAVGVWDDFSKQRGEGVSAPAKLAGQILAGGVVFLAGVRLEYFLVPLFRGSIFLDENTSAIATILWIVLLVNAVNLIDGLDGLAAGIVAIAAAAFFIYSYQVSEGLAGVEHRNAPLIAVIIVGATIGFLRYNFNPAKIFMGDSGAYTLGFLIAVSSVIGIGRTATNPIAESLLFYLPLAIPLIVLALPLLDLTFAVVRRATKGKHPFYADKEHLHHRLLELGHGHKQAVLIMYAWTAVVAGVTLSFSFVPNPVFRLMFAGAAVAILLYTLLPSLVRSKP